MRLLEEVERRTRQMEEISMALRFSVDRMLQKARSFSDTGSPYIIAPSVVRLGGSMGTGAQFPPQTCLKYRSLVSWLRSPGIF